jgi:hypothetical protein
MMDLLFVGVGWTGLEITLNRIAVGESNRSPVIARQTY